MKTIIIGIGGTSSSFISRIFMHLRNQSYRTIIVLSSPRTLDSSILADCSKNAWDLSLRRLSRIHESIQKNTTKENLFHEELQIFRGKTNQTFREIDKVRTMVRRSWNNPFYRQSYTDPNKMVSLRAFSLISYIPSYCPFMGNRRAMPQAVHKAIHQKKKIHLYIQFGGQTAMKTVTQQDVEGGIGNVLYSLRLIEKLSVKELAEKMGVSPTYICDVEANRKRPSLDRLELYSEALNVNVHTLIYFNEEGKKCRYNHKKLLFKILEELVRISE